LVITAFKAVILPFAAFPAFLGDAETGGIARLRGQ